MILIKFKKKKKLIEIKKKDFMEKNKFKKIIKKN